MLAEAPRLRARDRILDAATLRLSRHGIRGTTLRAIAHDAGTTLASLESLFGSKDDLVIACFDAAVNRDATRLADLSATCVQMRLDRDYLADLLWTLCETGPGPDSIDQLLCLELWLQTPQNPAYAPACRRWIVGRRDGIRAIGRIFGLCDNVADILALHLISESLFAVSCSAAPAWRVAARAGFVEAVVRLTGWPQAGHAGSTADLATSFYADRNEQPVRAPHASRRGRTLIVNAAAAIIEESGLGAVTNRAVAARAGVSLSSTTYHFRSVGDLAFHGVLRLFEIARASAPAIRRLENTMENARGWIATRASPTAIERVGTRGMAEISLAAARGQLPLALGVGIRRQRGTVTDGVLKASGFTNISRSCVASHSLWFAGVFLTTAAVSDAETLFDFEAQAETTARALLGFA